MNSFIVEEKVIQTKKLEKDIREVCNESVLKKCRKRVMLVIVELEQICSLLTTET